MSEARLRPSLILCVPTVMVASLFSPQLRTSLGNGRGTFCYGRVGDKTSRSFSWEGPQVLAPLDFDFNDIARLQCGFVSRVETDHATLMRTTDRDGVIRLASFPARDFGLYVQ